MARVPVPALIMTWVTFPRRQIPLSPSTLQRWKYLCSSKSCLFETSHPQTSSAASASSTSSLGKQDVPGTFILTGYDAEKWEKLCCEGG